MVLRIPRRAVVVGGIVLVVVGLFDALLFVVIFIRALLFLFLVVRLGVQEFVLDEPDVAEVSRSAARVELPRPKWMARRGAWMA
jgi:hypothetical protein